MRGRLFRNLLYLLSVGLAVHLLLPQIPGLTRSLRLVSGSSGPLIAAAYLAELASDLSYAELLGRSAGLASRRGVSRRRRRRAGLGLLYTLRLTIVGNGAAHVLPGGGATSAAIMYGALRTRGLKPRQIAGAVATVTTLIYTALGTFFLLCLIYLLRNDALGPAATVFSLLALALTLILLTAAYFAYRSPRATQRLLARLLRPAGRFADGILPDRDVSSWAERAVRVVRADIRGARRQMSGRPLEEVKLVVLAFGYWLFDAACLVLMFHALEVEAPVLKLLVAYGVATAAGSLPITPGGVGVFETTMLATLALLGIGSEAVVPILGYRIFNFWLPVPLAPVLYLTLRRKVPGRP